MTHQLSLSRVFREHPWKAPEGLFPKVGKLGLAPQRVSGKLGQTQGAWPVSALSTQSVFIALSVNKMSIDAVWAQGPAG